MAHDAISQLAIALFRQKGLNHRGIERTVTLQSYLFGRDFDEIPFHQRVPHPGEIIIHVHAEGILKRPAIKFETEQIAEYQGNLEVVPFMPEAAFHRESA